MACNQGASLFLVAHLEGLRAADRTWELINATFQKRQTQVRGNFWRGIPKDLS